MGTFSGTALAAAFRFSYEAFGVTSPEAEPSFENAPDAASEEGGSPGFREVGREADFA